MGRNLYILAATFGVLALIAAILSFTNVAHGPASPGDAALWRTTAVVTLILALVTALAGTLSALFEQAERRHEQQRETARRARREGRD